ncbi:MAG: hypothetical protein V9E81_09420 [Marmoricola sp.]
MSEVRTGRRFFRRPHPWFRGILIMLLSLSLVTLGVSGYLLYLQGNITTIDTSNDHLVSEDPTESAAPTHPMNVLVLGSDTRKGKGNHVAGSTPWAL